MIVEHGIKTKRFGKFNVGWLTFKNDEIAIKCLKIGAIIVLIGVTIMSKIISMQTKNILMIGQRL